MLSNVVSEQVPLGLLIGRGPEDLAAAGAIRYRSTSSTEKAERQHDDINSSQSVQAVHQHSGSDNTTQADPMLRAPLKQQLQWSRCSAFIMMFAVWSMALLVLSDISLRRHPQAQCLPRLWYVVRTALGMSSQAGFRGQLNGVSNLSADTVHDVFGTCWMGSTYGLILAVQDYTPNIGVFWYFFTEMFDAFRSFFRFVFHSHAVIMLVPLALRFSQRPVFLVFCQLLITSLFKPYPSVADLVPWMTLLPLLQSQLQQLQLGLFLLNSLLLLGVLGPAMWHQWILVDAANSNFFYSITLLFGVWQVLLLVQMLMMTVRVDRIAEGKPLAGKPKQE